jgi:uncharacterized protein with HEPN domain
MPRDSRLHVEDILRAVQKIREYSAGMDRDAFLADGRTVDAVIRNLEVIGEAARCVPEEIRRLAPGIEWRKVVGLRDVLIHAYFGVDLDIVWDIVSNKIPELEDRIQTLLRRMGTTDDEDRP